MLVLAIAVNLFNVFWQLDCSVNAALHIMSFGMLRKPRSKSKTAPLIR